MTEDSNATAWWRTKRKRYNVALVLAGVAAFACYAAVVEHFSCGGPNCPPNAADLEITIFTTAFQGMGYLFAMVVANILYGLGPLSERLFDPGT